MKEGRIVKRPQSLQSQVFDYLLEAITTGRLPFGTLLSEKVVAAELVTSKTPVREAFVQLQSLGLVDTRPQRGWLVFQPTARQISELCEVRVILEAAALRAAAEHDRDRLVSALSAIHERASKKTRARAALQYQMHDDAFHLALFRNCNNDTLLSAYEIFRPRIHTLRVNLQNQNPSLFGVSSQDHADIIARIAEGRIGPAVDVVSRHIRRMASAYSLHWESLVPPRA